MNTINEELARTAHDMNSYSDYRPGHATSEYNQQVAEAMEIAERQKKKVDPMYHEKIDYLLALYCSKLAANINHANAIDARCPSVLIAGPSNFPTRKKERQNAARDTNYHEYEYIQGLLDKIKSTGMAGISGSDPNAIEKLKAKLAKEEEYHAKVKATPGHEPWMLSNSSAEIRRIKQRIAELENRPQYQGWSFDGGKVVINEEIGRVQIILDAKPASTEIYKTNGFKWSPRNMAWQRQLTDNGVRAAKRVTLKVD